MSLGIGVIGCGSVFDVAYSGLIDRVRAQNRVHLSAVYDIDPRKRRDAAARYDVDAELAGPEAVIGHDDVDVVLVLTSMNEHGPFARAALEAGKHVLVEKPMATSLEDAAALLELRSHVLLSPTFRAIHGAVREGVIGRLLTARGGTVIPDRGGASGST